jgi:hypothetical protein
VAFSLKGIFSPNFLSPFFVLTRRGLVSGAFFL